MVLFGFRSFQASPGRLEALHARLRDREIPLLEQHGIFTLAVFVSAGKNPGNLIYFITVAEGLTATTEGWGGFRKDPKWLEVLAETDKDGPLMARELRERLNLIHWSPKFPPDGTSMEPSVFELRMHTSSDRSKHAALTRRFRDHTVKLLEKHGMQNLVYWTPEVNPDNAPRLVYLLEHESTEAAKASFSAFRQDPEWLEVKEQSEEMAGDSLTAEKNGVVSQFLVATEYSPLE